MSLPYPGSYTDWFLLKILIMCWLHPIFNIRHNIISTGHFPYPPPSDIHVYIIQIFASISVMCILQPFLYNRILTSIIYTHKDGSLLKFLFMCLFQPIFNIRHNKIFTYHFSFPGFYTDRSLLKILIMCILQPIFTQYDIYKTFSLPWFLYRQIIALISFLCLLLSDTEYYRWPFDLALTLDCIVSLLFPCLPFMMKY